jgi:hypothetical protein
VTDRWSKAYRNRAQQRVQTTYDWDGVVDQYEQLFRRMSGLAVPDRSGCLPESSEVEVLEKSGAVN